MKSIKTYLLPLLLLTFFSTSVFAQNDFYNGEKEQEKIEQKISTTDSILVYGYYTEIDYNEIHGIEKPKNNVDSEFYYGDEVRDKEKHRKKDSFLSEVAAEVIVEVVINAVFILATFWH
ncbi:MAG: hypothetical protein JKX68_05015 [Flavobacteriales bacterium]|nr:hypothetical protein [Flavobacteriales bacterium]